MEGGDHAAAECLLSLLYTELRRLAEAKLQQEHPGQTLQPTALVHEAWMRVGKNTFANRAHFFSAASEAMRRILVDRARRKLREKRGGGAEHLELNECEIASPIRNDEELLEVHAALEKLALLHGRKAELVKLRYFAGLTFEEAAEVLEISLPTAHRDWAFARAWLRREIDTERQTQQD